MVSIDPSQGFGKKKLESLQVGAPGFKVPRSCCVLGVSEHVLMGESPERGGGMRITRGKGIRRRFKVTHRRCLKIPQRQTLSKLREVLSAQGSSPRTPVLSAGRLGGMASAACRRYLHFP